MIPDRRQLLDDTFSAFSMFAEHNFVTLYDAKEKISRFSPGAVRIFNLPSEYISDGTLTWENYIHPDDRSLYRKTMHQLLEGKQLNYDLTYRCKIWDGSYTVFRFVGAVIRDGTGKPSLLGGLIINAGRLEFTDPTTMLNNKDGFFKDLAALQAGNISSIILLLGINELPTINKEFSYSQGNHVLQQVAWLIQETVGTKGIVYRMEGRRFAIISRSLDERAMRDLHTKITQQLRLGISLGDSRQTISTSAGLFVVNDSSLSGAVIYDCLQSVYKDSRNRQNGALVAFNTSDELESKNVAIIDCFRHSIMNDCENFSLVYQPVFSKNTRKMIGLEALLRWHDKDLGTFSAEDYMPILVQDFAFEELGIWILRQVMQEGKTILTLRPELVINVNIAAAQLLDVCFQESVESLLRQTGYPANNLCLELSGPCRLLPTKKVLERTQRLQELGIRLALDDFGTGMRNLEFLQALPLDHVKFDAALLRDSLTSPLAKNDLTLLSTLVSSHNTNICIKCVENESMQEAVKDIPFDFVQGFAYAYPMPLAALLEIL